MTQGRRTLSVVPGWARSECLGALTVTYLECRERLARMDQMLNSVASEADTEARRVALRTILKLNPAADLIVHARATSDEALVAPIVRDLSDVQPLLVAGLAGEILAGPSAATFIAEARNRLASHLNVLGALAASERQPDDASRMRRSAPARWAPPTGYVGRKTICHNARFMKNGKSPSPTTIDGWVKSAERQGTPISIEKDPANGENYYPAQWIMERIATWNPRVPRT